MLTKEQWSDLARFAGVEVEDVGAMPDGNPWLWMPSQAHYWQPLTDWRDFGPLLVLLHHWRSAGNYFHGTPKYLGLSMECREAMIALDVAETTNDQQRWMQAGCAFGAAIGATMGDK